MRAPKRVPKKVVEKAKAVARPEPAKAPKAPENKVREKLVAHLRRLHPMD